MMRKTKSMSKHFLHMHELELNDKGEDCKDNCSICKQLISESNFYHCNLCPEKMCIHEYSALKFHSNWITIPFTLSTRFSFLKKSNEPTFAMLVATIVMEASSTSVWTMLLSSMSTALSSPKTTTTNNSTTSRRRRRFSFNFSSRSFPITLIP
ncbi:hypothetical protein ACSBR1_039564 [Camellia fascicularis]